MTQLVLFKFTNGNEYKTTIHGQLQYVNYVSQMKNPSDVINEIDDDSYNLDNLDKASNMTVPIVKSLNEITIEIPLN
jgi:hypothetical protein